MLYTTTIFATWHSCIKYALNFSVRCAYSLAVHIPALYIIYSCSVRQLTITHNTHNSSTHSIHSHKSHPFLVCNRRHNARVCVEIESRLCRFTVHYYALCWFLTIFCCFVRECTMEFYFRVGYHYPDFFLHIVRHLHARRRPFLYTPQQ